MGDEFITSHDADDSLAVRRTEESGVPFTAEELLVLGRKYAQTRRIGMSWREDAAQEFAIAGVDAVGQVTSSDNVRAFQIKAGKWAVAELWRSIHRRKQYQAKFNREQYGCLEHFARIDPEAMVDPSADDPQDMAIQQEEREKLRRVINTLPSPEREMLSSVIYDKKTMRTVALEHGTSKSTVERICREACAMVTTGCLEKPG